MNPGDISSMEEAARAVIGEDGKVIVDRINSRLLVLTTEARHKQMADLAAQVNLSPRNVRIEVQDEENGTQPVRVPGSKAAALSRLGLGKSLQEQSL